MHTAAVLGFCLKSTRHSWTENVFYTIHAQHFQMQDDEAEQTVDLYL